MHSEVPLPTRHNGYNGKVPTVPRISKDVEQLELSNPAGGDVKLYNYVGKLFDSTY